MPQLINQTTNQVIAGQVLFAHHFFKRVRGLLAFKSLESHQVMWIKPCSSIHTLFMKFPIDVVFVDKNLCVQSIHKNISPWKMLSGGRKAMNPLAWLIHPSTYQLRKFWSLHSVFEFPGGLLEQKNFLKKGDQIHVGSSNS